MSRGDLQEMEVGTKQSKTAVNANAKAAEAMPHLSGSTPGQTSGWEDLGGPTPENYKSDDDSAKLKTPGATLKQVRDVVNKGAKVAEPMKSVKEEEELEDEDLIDEENEEGSFQHCWMGSENLDIIKALQKGKGGKKDILNITIEGRLVDAFETPNVVGVIEGTDPELKNEYVIYSAHYDHVGIGRPDAEGDTIYNGARDNAIGTAGVLAAVEHLSKYPTKRSALFISFTGEEKGLLGSKWFAKHPPFPLKQIIYCFNIDNAGYNDTSLVTVFGLGRTTAERHMMDACKTFGLRAIDDPAPEQGLFDRSDNVSFAEKGIPAPTFSMGFTAFDEEIFKYYHQASDEADSMDYPYLLKYIRSFLLSGRFIANDPAKPFWTKGDKYYDVGVELYGL